jgi:hypothetical protein
MIPKGIIYGTSNPKRLDVARCGDGRHGKGSCQGKECMAKNGI